jgi:glutathione S-transferase
MQTTADTLITRNDTEFKPLLDRYKYHTRHPELTQSGHKANAAPLLQSLEERLARHAFLMRDTASLADIAIFPFIRQWHGVEASSLESFPHLLAWLQSHEQSPLFAAAMGR